MEKVQDFDAYPSQVKRVVVVTRVNERVNERMNRRSQIGKYSLSVKPGEAGGTMVTACQGSFTILHSASEPGCC